MPDRVILTVGNVHLNHVNECYWNCGRLSCVCATYRVSVGRTPLARNILMLSDLLDLLDHEETVKTVSTRSNKSGNLAFHFES